MRAGFYTLHGEGFRRPGWESSLSWVAAQKLELSHLSSRVNILQDL